MLLLMQALSHRTLVTLMRADPAKSQPEVISAAEPHVAFAYLKHLWHSDKKVIGLIIIIIIIIIRSTKNNDNTIN